ncbi:MAG: hypothetical protein ACFE9R_21095, partial [Candidatus Hermodarchaeota archaeon]
MESLQIIDKLEIETNKIFYDKKTEVLSVYISEFVFIGTYKKSARVKQILDDIFESLKSSQLIRENITLVDFVTLKPIAENLKLRQLKLISKKQKETEEFKKEEEPLKQIKPEEKKRKKAAKPVTAPTPKAAKALEPEESVFDDEEVSYEEEVYKERSRSEILFSEDLSGKKDEKMREAPLPSMAPPPPPSAPASGGIPARALFEEEKKSEIAPEPPKPIIYEINMGLQYYSVMMEQNSYLFYVYLS